MKTWAPGTRKHAQEIALAITSGAVPRVVVNRDPSTFERLEIDPTLEEALRELSDASGGGLRVFRMDGDLIVTRAKGGRSR